jgi:hypothetical protein
LTATVEKESEGKFKVLIAADQDVGPVTIDAETSAVTSQALSLPRGIDDLPQDLSGTRASGHDGLADLAIDSGPLRRHTDAAAPGFVACAQKIGSATWTRVSVDATSGSGGTPDRLDLVLPKSLRPGLMDLALPLRIAVATLDGKAIAVGSMSLVGRAWAAGAATLVIALLFGIVMYQHGKQRIASGAKDDPRWLSGLFLGSDRQPSLSLLQVFLWTVITAWGMAYVFVTSGQLLALTPEMMALLGLAGTGSVLARWIGASGSGTANPTPVVSKTATSGADNGSPVDNDFFRMLSSNGGFDLMKMQLFVFTLLIAMYVVWRIVDAAAFPALDPNMLMLMGVSQGVYVTSKWTTTTPLVNAQTLKLSVDAQTADVERLKALPAKAEDLKAATDKLTALQADYDKALAAIGLKRL